MKEVKLKVIEAVPDDVEKGIVRIDSNFMKDLGIKPGDIVDITGDRRTVAIADRAYPGDIGLNIIRMDGIIRKNAKTGIGELVTVKKADIKEAKKITIAPARKGVIIKASQNTFKHGLLGRAAVKGDVISLGGTRRRRTTLSDNPFFDDMDIFRGLGLDDNFSFGFGDIKFVVADTNPKEAVIITESTEIVLNPEAVEVKEEVVSDVNYEDIGGLTEEIKKIREMVELPLKHPEIFDKLGIEPPKGVLLHGPPGTGKTLLAKAVANETDSHFSVINGPEVMSKFYGESEANLRKIFEEAEKNAPSIIFIDEIDSLAPKREESKGEVERRVVAQLLALMDGLKSRGKVVVIAATNIPNAIDPALRRPGRFDREISINVPDQSGRETILKIHTRKMPLDDDVDLDALAAITYGFVGADLESLAKESAMVVLRKVLPDLKIKEDEPLPKDLLEKLIIHQEDFIEALKVVRPSGMREVLIEKPNIKWTDIGGLEEVKERLIEAVEWPLKNPKSFQKLGITPPRGILMYGAPGTGKTLLAKAVATESKANFILIKGPELLSKWVGESEKAVREIFRKARQTSPTIVFFDEMDALAPKRGMDTGSKVVESVVNQLLTEIDGLERLKDVVVIAATNRPDIIDPALLRPGRFDQLLLIPIPDKDTRKKIFEVHTKNMPTKSVKVDDLVEKTDGYTGSDIEALCREAAMKAMREAKEKKSKEAKEVNQKHFEAALKEVGPSVTKDINKMYTEIKKALKASTAQQMKEETANYFG